RSDFPASDAVAGVLGEKGDLAFTLFSLLSIGALCSLQVMTVTRITFASARDRILPGWFESVNHRGVPMRAMVLVCVTAAAFLWSGTYLALSSTSTALSQAILLLVALCSVRLMLQEPDLNRPWRIPFYWPAIVAVILFDALLLAVFVAQDPFFALLGFGMVAGLSLAYRMFARPRPAGPETEIP
ncbi:MAG: amino acid permease, partial [Tsuneonella sp.]